MRVVLETCGEILSTRFIILDKDRGQNVQGKKEKSEDLKLGNGYGLGFGLNSVPK